MENPYLDEPDVEIPTQINTNNKDDKIDKTKKYYICCDLTQELIKLEYIDSSSNNLFLYDELFEDLLNKYSFTDLIIKSRYIVSNLKSRNFKDENDNLIEDKFIYFKTSLLSNINKMENNPNKFSASDAFINAGANSIEGAVRKVMLRASYNSSYYRRIKNMI